jgi:hypothetical protein
LSIELRAVSARVENRLDFAMQALAGLDLAIPGVHAALEAIGEARETISVLPPASRGISKKGDDDLSAFSIETATAGD